MRRLHDLRSTVLVLWELDVTSVTNAVDAATGMPAVELCAEIDALPETIDPPANAADRSELAALGERLSLVDALHRAGRSDEALAVADRALRSARELSYPPALRDAALALGSVLVLRYDFPDAIEPLGLAEQLALEHRQLGAAVVAGARRVYAEAMRGMRLDRLAGQLDMLELLSRGLRDDRFARSRLLSYAGTVYMAREDRDQARQYFEAARASLAGPVPNDQELMTIDMNLAMLTPDRATRESLAHAAWRRFYDQLGPQHLMTLSEQCRYAHYMLDPIAALALLRDADELYRQFHPRRFRDRSLCMSYLAFLTADVDDLAAAATLYGEIVALAIDSTDEDVVTRAQLASGYMQLYRGGLDAALAQFAVVIAAFANSEHWWDQQLAAEGHLGAGLAELARGRSDAAAAHFEHAATTFAGVAARNEDVEPRQRLALTRVHLATTLRATKTAANDGRARALEAQAQAFYHDASLTAYHRRLAGLPSQDQP